MILLTFSAQRKIIKFLIDGKIVKYFDDIWKWPDVGIQIYPMDRMMVKRLTLSRKQGLSAMGLLIIDANQGKNLEQYENCKTEEDIAKYITDDCELKGLVKVG